MCPTAAKTGPQLAAIQLANLFNKPSAPVLIHLGAILTSSRSIMNGGGVLTIDKASMTMACGSRVTCKAVRVLSKGKVVKKQ